jgi:hypothetical protein
MLRFKKRKKEAGKKNQKAKKVLIFKTRKTKKKTEQKTK